MVHRLYGFVPCLVVSQQQAQQSGFDSVPDEAIQCNPVADTTSADQKKKPLQNKGLCEPVQLGAPEYRSSGAGIRTPDTRIMIPLL